MASRKSSQRKKPVDDRETALVEKEQRLLADAPHPAPDPTGLDHVLKECESIAPGPLGQLMWVSNRCEMAGLNTINDLWMEIFLEYFESKKPIFLIHAGLRGGKTSNVLRALMLVAFLRRHNIQKGSIGTVPIMSATPELAQQSLLETIALMHAIGIEPPREDESVIVQPGGFGGNYRKTLNSSGGGKIDVLTKHGYTIRFLCNSITARHAMGFTAVGALLDELDGWREGSAYQNPATDVRDGLIHRMNTTRETACMFLASAWYPRVEIKSEIKSCHRLMMEAGDTDSVHVAKLGERGAATDEAMRLEFATAKKLKDERLLAPGDPNATGIPAWVINPTRTTVESCYQSSGEDLHRMFGEYGAQYPVFGSKDDTKLKELLALADANRQMNIQREATLDGGGAGTFELQRFPNLPSYDPRSTSYGGGGRGPRTL